MSGGHYNWLQHVEDLEDLHARRFDLEAMATRLAGLGYAQDAACETEELLVLFRQWETRAATRVARLSKVWEAIDYWDSNDRSEDTVKAALAAYRADTDGTPPP